MAAAYLLLADPAGAASVGVGLWGMEVSFGAVSPRDGPPVASRAVQLAVAADGPWRVTVAATGDFQTTVAGWPPIPVDRLEWALETAEGISWQPVSTAPVVVAEGIGGDEATLLALSLRLRVSWEDTPSPAPYRTTLVYTVSPGAFLTNSFAQAVPGPPDGPVAYSIGYWVPGSGTVPVHIQVSNEAGVLVRSVALEQRGGRWQTWVWDGADDAGRPVPRAPYYYTVTGPGGSLIAAGACLPPGEPGQKADDRGVASDVVMRHGLNSETPATPPQPRLELEVDKGAGAASAGDWLRLEWTLTNASSAWATGVTLEVTTPGWLRPFAATAKQPEQNGLVLERPAGSRWLVAVGDLAPGETRRGFLDVAVVPGAPLGTHTIALAALVEPTGEPVAGPVTVPVRVVPGPLSTGRLVARLVPPAGSSAPVDGIGFRILGGPRVRTDAAGVLTWAGPPGLYVLVPDDGTVPAGWSASPTIVRLAPGSLTYVEIPMVAAGDVPLRRGAFAAGATPQGVQIVSLFEEPGAKLQLRLDTRRADADREAGEPEPAVSVTLPLGLPWRGPVAFRLSGHGQHEGGAWHAALMAGPSGGPDREPGYPAEPYGGDAGAAGHRGASWGMHVVREDGKTRVGGMWVHGRDGAHPVDVLGAHWERSWGLLRLAGQALWMPAGAGSRALGVSAAAPLAGAWQVEATYRSVEPGFAVPWLEEPIQGGWALGLRWRNSSGHEWRGSVGFSGGRGPDVDLAGRLGSWELRQRLIQGGAWRPATSLIARLSGTGIWFALQEEGDAAIRWIVGGVAGSWTWSLRALGAAGGEARLGWHGTGPGEIRMRFQAAAWAGEESLAGQIAWRWQWERPGDGGSRWRGELAWQPQEVDAEATVSVGWRRPAPRRSIGDVGWADWEWRWQRGAQRETWQVILGRHWRWDSGAEVAGQFLWRRVLELGAGFDQGLDTGQLSLEWRQPLRDGWQSLVGVRWAVQWLGGGSVVSGGLEWDLGFVRTLGDGWQLAAGWRLPAAGGMAEGGPYVRVEWTPGTGVALDAPAVLP